MRDDLFSIPIRKYHLDDNKEQFVSFVESYYNNCLLYTSPSPRDSDQSRMPSSA